MCICIMEYCFITMAQAHFKVKLYSKLNYAHKHHLDARHWQVPREPSSIYRLIKVQLIMFLQEVFT